MEHPHLQQSSVQVAEYYGTMSVLAVKHLLFSLSQGGTDLEEDDEEQQHSSNQVAVCSNFYYITFQ